VMPEAMTDDELRSAAASASKRFGMMAEMLTQPPWSVRLCSAILIEQTERFLKFVVGNKE